MPSGHQRASPQDLVHSLPRPPALTLNPMPPFLQHRQASMRAMTVKSPEKDTATTDREDDQESSLSGAPSAEGERVTGQLCDPAPICTQSPRHTPGPAGSPRRAPRPPDSLRSEPQHPYPCSKTPHSEAQPPAQGRWTHGLATVTQACSPWPAPGCHTGLAKGQGAG